jgi:RimJ/RimL family protein N-acetyltransferase
MRAEIASGRKLATLLKVHLPKAWPPPLNDRDSQHWMLHYLQTHEGTRWGMYYIVLRRQRQLIGNCGFKGEPAKGAVELGYSIAPEYQRRGYASEAVRGLQKFAFADPRVQRVLGETLPDLIASIGVLRKCGFRRVSGASEPAVIRFSIPRHRYPAPS